ncbi:MULTISPECIES: hypothetical protein [Rhodococcus]|uniref:hypothetical protein n=1 Tax=Rhodococcus TaxID=1827 RepID=UPI0007CD811F|nr:MULTISPECIES: hypothetical protein [Rhodococcus]MDA3635121.1 hypothetical protein [Rhodococcus sp. C-2]
MARRLVQAGQTVWIGARDAENGRASADRLGAHFIQLDVTDDYVTVGREPADHPYHHTLVIRVRGPPHSVATRLPHPFETRHIDHPRSSQLSKSAKALNSYGLDVEELVRQFLECFGR